MERQKRKYSGFDDKHPFWPTALELWKRGRSNRQVAEQAQAQGYDFSEDQVRYARRRSWTADELPARGAKWLREAIREATEVYPSALAQQQTLFSENYDVFAALKERVLAYLQGEPPASELELTELKVLLDSFARQSRVLNEINDTVVVLQAKLGRLEAEPSTSDEEADPMGDEPWAA